MADYLEHESLYRGEDAVSGRDNVRILICGVGALGSWLVDLLARQGYNSLTVIDFDKVENANFGTQNYGKEDVGRLKAVQIKNNIFRRLRVSVDHKTKRLTADNVKQVAGYDLVLDLFDNAESRQLLQNACNEHKVECLHAGLGSMGFFEIKWNDCYEVPIIKEADVDVPCEYPMASNLVMMCVAALAEVVNRYVDKDQKENFEFWLNSMKMIKE